MPHSTAGRVLLSMIAATCVTLITNALDTSPTVSLVWGNSCCRRPGADYCWRPVYGIGLGVGVTAAALGVTYFGFTAVDVTTDRPLTFPAPKKVEKQLGVTTVSTETGETDANQGGSRSTSPSATSGFGETDERT